MNLASWSNRVRKFKWRVRFCVSSLFSWLLSVYPLLTLASLPPFFGPRERKDEKKQKKIWCSLQPSTNAPNHAFSSHRASEFARKNLNTNWKSVIHAHAIHLRYKMSFAVSSFVGTRVVAKTNVRASASSKRASVQVFAERKLWCVPLPPRSNFFFCTKWIARTRARARGLERVFDRFHSICRRDWMAR